MLASKQTQHFRFFQYEDETDVAETFGLGARFNTVQVIYTVQFRPLIKKVLLLTTICTVSVTYNLASNVYVYAEYGQETKLKIGYCSRCYIPILILTSKGLCWFQGSQLGLC